MIKTLISVAGVAVVLMLACFGAYLLNRDKIQQHEIRLEYIEKSYQEQKEALVKVADNLAALEKTFAKLVGELEHLKKRNYYGKNNNDDRSRFAISSGERLCN